MALVSGPTTPCSGPASQVSGVAPDSRACRNDGSYGEKNSHVLSGSSPCGKEPPLLLLSDQQAAESNAYEEAREHHPQVSTVQPQRHTPQSTPHDSNPAPLPVCIKPGRISQLLAEQTGAANSQSKKATSAPIVKCPSSSGQHAPGASTSIHSSPPHTVPQGQWSSPCTTPLLPRTSSNPSPLESTQSGAPSSAPTAAGAAASGPGGSMTDGEAQLRNLPACPQTPLGQAPAPNAAAAGDTTPTSANGQASDEQTSVIGRSERVAPAKEPPPTADAAAAAAASESALGDERREEEDGRSEEGRRTAASESQGEGVGSEPGSCWQGDGEGGKEGGCGKLEVARREDGVKAKEEEGERGDQSSR